VKHKKYPNSFYASLPMKIEERKERGSKLRKKEKIKAILQISTRAFDLL
jgi:hypothetical protein